MAAVEEESAAVEVAAAPVAQTINKGVKLSLPDNYENLIVRTSARRAAKPPRVENACHAGLALVKLPAYPPLGTLRVTTAQGSI